MTKRIVTSKSVAPPKVKGPARNRPCPCGSGKKYKRCCLPKDQPPETGLAQAVAKKVLKNTFRDEVKDPLAGISEEELLARDQVIMLAQYETRQKLVRMDIEHLGRIEAVVKELRVFISQRPISLGRQGALGDIEAQLKALAEQRASTIFSRPNQVTMFSLRKVLNDSHIVKHSDEEIKIVESEDRKLEQKLDVKTVSKDSLESETLIIVDEDETMQNEHLDPNESLEGAESSSPKVPGETTDSFKPMPGDGEIKTDGEGDSERQLDRDFDTEDTV